MAEFAYNNLKNVSIDHIPFKFMCGFYFKVFYKKNLNFAINSKAAKKLLSSLRELTAN